jgi:hypothetical protein
MIYFRILKCFKLPSGGANGNPGGSGGGAGNSLINYVRPKLINPINTSE